VSEQVSHRTEASALFSYRRASGLDADGGWLARDTGPIASAFLVASWPVVGTHLGGSMGHAGQQTQTVTVKFGGPVDRTGTPGKVADLSDGDNGTGVKVAEHSGLP
jgi:hypothetical protein